MNLRFLACALCAAGVHLFILFGLRVGTTAVALPMSDEPTSVDIAVVEEIPPPPEPEPPPQPPEPPPPEPAPPPPPPEPMTEPTSEPPAPEQHIPPPKPPRSAPPKPALPHTAVSHAAPGISARPQYRSNPKPDYPAEARRLREEGVVMLSVSVSSEGRVTGVSVAQSSGHPLLDQAALEAVRHWTFEPAQALGFPVTSKPTVPVRFKLPAQ